MRGFVSVADDVADAAASGDLARGEGSPSRTWVSASCRRGSFEVDASLNEVGSIGGPWAREPVAASVVPRTRG